MPQIPLNATNAQATRLGQARDRYNAANEKAYTTKQFIYAVLREAVDNYLAPDVQAAAQAAAQTVRDAIAADMEGDA